MTLLDHLRFLGRRFAGNETALVFLDGFPAPTEQQLAETHAAALAAWTEEQARAQTPASVSMRQLRLWLHGAGLLDTVDAAVQAAGGTALIEWEYAVSVERGNALVASLAGALGLSGEQVDAAFVEASTL